MADLMPLPELVRDFLDKTRLGPTELGRRAADATGTPMSNNTISKVMRGGPYNADTERRLRRAIDAYATIVSAYSGQYDPEIHGAADDLARDDD